MAIKVMFVRACECLGRAKLWAYLSVWHETGGGFIGPRRSYIRLTRLFADIDLKPLCHVNDSEKWNCTMDENESKQFPLWFFDVGPAQSLFFGTTNDMQII